LHLEHSADEENRWFFPLSDLSVVKILARPNGLPNERTATLMYDEALKRIVLDAAGITAMHSDGLRESCTGVDAYYHYAAGG